MTSSDTVIIILVMTLAAALCRLGGYWFMGFVAITPRLEAGLKALPLGVMVGLMVPPVIKGGWPEAAGIAVTMALTRLKLNEFFAILGGLTAVGGLRALL